MRGASQRKKTPRDWRSGLYRHALKQRPCFAMWLDGFFLCGTGIPGFPQSEFEIRVWGNDFSPAVRSVLELLRVLRVSG